MSERAQEEAYFYRINHALIQQMHRQNAFILLPDPRSNQKSLYDILDQNLRPDEGWHVDICF